MQHSQKIAIVLFTVILAAAWFGLRKSPEPSAMTKAPEQSSHDHSEAQVATHGHAAGEHPEARFVPVFDVNVAEAFSFEPNEGKPCKLTYRLAQPARVSIRVKKKGTRELYLATIVGWDLREPGTHEETWDGRDYSGNVVDMSEATLSVVAEKASYQEATMSLAAKSDEEIVHGEKDHIHGTHHRDAEETPVLRVTQPSQRAELSGLIEIRSEVDRTKRGYGDRFGYGVRYYVDNVLANEEFYRPESDGMFAYALDTTAFEDGKHTLYVGFCDHNQHVTSAGVEVFFKNQPD